MIRYRYPKGLTHTAARESVFDAIGGTPVNANLTRNDWFSLEGDHGDLVEVGLKLEFALDQAP